MELRQNMEHAVEDGESRCTGQSLIDTGKSSLMSSFQQPGSALRLRGSGCCPSKAEERSSSSAVSTASIKPKMASREDIVSVCRSDDIPTDSCWLQFGGTSLEPHLEVTTLVCLRWLVRVAQLDGDCARFGGVIPAWQNLPPEAHADLRRMQLFTGKKRQQHW